jgi:nucleoside 2-deoxyribosyltransferase
LPHRNSTPTFKVYTASKAKKYHTKLWRRLREELQPLGIIINSTWIDFDTEPTDKQSWISLWSACINEASNCSILLALYRRHEKPKGQNVEVGAALASGKPVYIVRPKGMKVGDFAHHPLVTWFDTLDEALTSIKQKATLLNKPAAKSSANNVVQFRKKKTA